MAKEPSSKYTKRYSPEFEGEAVTLLRSSGRPVSPVATELGISDMTLAACARELEKNAATLDREMAEKQEKMRLRNRIKELGNEIEIP